LAEAKIHSGNEDGVSSLPSPVKSSPLAGYSLSYLSPFKGKVRVGWDHSNPVAGSGLSHYQPHPPASLEEGWIKGKEHRLLGNGKEVMRKTYALIEEHVSFVNQKSLQRLLFSNKLSRR
jgi:hypothetical protein